MPNSFWNTLIPNRETAVQKALELGMSLTEVQKYLDWLDNTSNKEGKLEAGDNIQISTDKTDGPTSNSTQMDAH